jgi:hypothetical protein
MRHPDAAAQPSAPHAGLHTAVYSRLRECPCSEERGHAAERLHGTAARDPTMGRQRPSRSAGAAPEGIKGHLYAYRTDASRANTGRLRVRGPVPTWPPRP